MLKSEMLEERMGEKADFSLPDEEKRLTDTSYDADNAPKGSGVTLSCNAI
jgi:hypothetical protein